MTLTGSAYLFGGPGENSNASIFAAGGGALNFSVNGDLTLISTAVNPVNSLSVAFIGTNFFSSGGGPLNVQVGGDLFMQGGSPSANPGVFTLAALVGGSDTRIIVNGSATLRSGSPGVSANCGAVIRGFSGPVYFSANSLTMSGTALGGNASILSAANTTAISQGNISTNLGTISGLADTYIESVSGAINAIDSTFAGTNGFLTMLAPQSIFFDPTTLTATTGIFVKAGVDISFINNSSATTTAGPITLVVDDQFPAPPQIGPGRFVIDSTSFINANQFPISIYTARQQLNSISPFATFNGAFFVAGTLYIDSLEEIWCTYFPTQLLPAVPFKISYKDCLSAALQSATLIVDEFLEGMHPADEYLGWCERFTIERLGEDEKRTYSISRRKLQFINHPKTWTALIHFIPKSE